jgi:hypothetical protein
MASAPSLILTARPILSVRMASCRHMSHLGTEAVVGLAYLLRSIFPFQLAVKLVWGRIGANRDGMSGGEARVLKGLIRLSSHQESDNGGDVGWPI